MSCHAAATDAEDGVASGLLLLQDMVLPHGLLLLLRRHKLLQLLHRHRRRGRGGEAGARAVPRAAHVPWHLQAASPPRDEKRNRSDPTLEGLGRRDVAGIRQIERQLWGRSQDPTLENSVDSDK